jgi:transposase
MTRKIRKYSKEFKAEAINLALNSDNITQVAKELGIPDATLHTWLHKAKQRRERVAQDTNGVSCQININDLLKQNQELKKRLARAEQEKAILKKAATYFARELE